MSNSQNIKEEYAAQVQILLNGQQPQLLEFRRLWKDSKFREAYLFVYELIREKGIEPTSEFKKADEDFYWLFVN